MYRCLLAAVLLATPAFTLKGGNPVHVKPDDKTDDQPATIVYKSYADYLTEKAAEQASRCSQCGVPFCQVHCPLHNNIPDWLKLTAEGRLEEAYELFASQRDGVMKVGIRP